MSIVGWACGSTQNVVCARHRRKHGVTLGAGGASRQTAEFGDEGVKERSGGGGGNWEAGARGGCRAGHVSYLVHAIRYPISRVVPRAAPCVPRPRPRAVFSLIHVDSACMMRISTLPRADTRQPSPPSLPGPRRAVTRRALRTVVRTGRRGRGGRGGRLVLSPPLTPRLLVPV